MFRFRMLLVSMLLFVFCCPLVSHAELDEASMMENAKSNYQEGGYYFATTWLERILKNWPGTPQREEVLLMMSKAYAATGRDEKALTTVRTLLKEFPRASDKLDPAVVSLVKEIEARKTGPYSSFEPVGLPAASTPAANAAVEPAPSPAAASAAEAANTAAAAIPTSPAPATHAEPPATAPVAAPAPAETQAPGIAAVPVEAPAAVKAQVTTPPEAVDAKSAPALAAPALAAAEPPKAAPAPAEPVAEKAPVEVNAPVAVELPASPVAAVDSPVPAKVEKVAEASPEDPKAGSAMTYTLELGEYVGQNTLSGAKRLVRKAGLTPVVTPGPMREEKMLRIQVGQFAEHEAAKRFQDKIRGIDADQFMLVNKEGAYRVFAGSYSDRAAAKAEQKRLAGRGIKSELKQVTVSVPTFVLTAGTFPTEKSANDTLTALERLGLKGEVLVAQ